MVQGVIAAHASGDGGDDQEELRRTRMIQSGPTESSTQGSAKRRPPTASRAITAGQRGSRFSEDVIVTSMMLGANFGGEMHDLHDTSELARKD